MFETEVWRLIPPEEKLKLIAKAQGNGVMAALGYVLVFGTVGVGLALPWLVWIAVLSMPLVFQMNAGRSWRRLRPKLMLSYLAARSAARRYAFTCNAQDLAVSFIFRGTLARQYTEEQIQDSLEDAINNVKEVEVWVTLFRDAVVMISEGPGGAALEFGQALNERLVVTPQAKTGDRSITLGIRDKERGEALFALRSTCPAALVVFEKRLMAQREEIRRNNERIAAATAASASPGLLDE